MKANVQPAYAESFGVASAQPAFATLRRGKRPASTPKSEVRDGEALSPGCRGDHSPVKSNSQFGRADLTLV